MFDQRFLGVFACEFALLVETRVGGRGALSAEKSVWNGSVDEVSFFVYPRSGLGGFMVILCLRPKPSSVSTSVARKGSTSWSEAEPRTWSLARSRTIWWWESQARTRVFCRARSIRYT